MISGSKKNFFPSAWIGLKTTSQGKSGPKKRFKEVSDLLEVCEKSYGQKSKKIFFAYNFFQRLPRALKPVLNAFLGPNYPKKVVRRHIQTLGKNLKLEIFRPQNHW